MKNESGSFSAEDLDLFWNELADHDRLLLAERLERGSGRLEVLAERLSEQATIPAGDQWSAHQVLAHIAVLSKFYGVLTHQIGSGKLTELDLLSNVHLRDVLGEQLAAMPGRELVEMALAEQRRTIAYLRSATAGDLRRRCEMGGSGSMDAAEVARLPLCAHLEIHLDQLESALPAELPRRSMGFQTT